MKKALLIGGGLIGAYLIYRAIKKGKKDGITESAILTPPSPMIVGVPPINMLDKIKLGQFTPNVSLTNVVTTQSFSRPSNPLDWTSGMLTQYIDEKAKPMPLNVREQIISDWITFAGSKKQSSEYIRLSRNMPAFAVKYGNDEFAKQVDVKISEWAKTQIDPKLTSIIMGSRTLTGGTGI